ncbi:MAG TPA: hypothetical protein VLD39_02340 [Gammaproteobacteria bacterium]|nr:hypothetical protein [Gammaproteobacteria bacterium]
MTSAISTRHLGMTVVTLTLLSACGVTARMEPYKQTNVVIEEGDQVVVLARKHHATHEAEEGFVECISDSLARGRRGIGVHPTKDFEDMLYPWFEPSMAPLSTEEMSQLLEKPGVMERVRGTGVRFLIWLDGSTERTSSGGGISCAAGVGGAGCMGLAWWEDDARYDATVWDIEQLENAGTIYADFRGRSVMPAIIIPIPLIARPQAHACRGLTDQLREFLTSPYGYGAGPDPELG